mgnify:CR=1 FL=1
MSDMSQRLRSFFNAMPRADFDGIRADDNHLETVIVDGDILVLADTFYNRLGVASVFRARQMTADVMASLPYTAGTTRLPAPNMEQSLADFVATTILSLQDCGDAYWFREGDEWFVLEADRVTVRFDRSRLRRIYTMGGVQLRPTGLTPNLIVLSVNRAAGDETGNGWMQSQRIRGVIAAQKYAEDYFKNNGNPTGILTVPNMATEDETDALLDQWMDARQSRTPAVMSSGITFESTSFNPTDSQWVETHRMSTGDVALLSGVPGALLDYSAPGSSLTYQSIHSVESLWVRNTLHPWYGRRLLEAFGKMFGAVIDVSYEQLELAGLQERASSAYQLGLAGYEPDSVADIVGLDDLTHTGKLPTALQEQ